MNVLYTYYYHHRILVDAAQTPSNKTKIAELKFVTNLASTYCRSEDFPKHPSSSKAIQKIVQLANDQKSVELRSQARLALIALYNCNTPEVSNIIIIQIEMIPLNWPQAILFIIVPLDDKHSQ